MLIFCIVGILIESLLGVYVVATVFDSYVHKPYICFKTGDCRLFANVGVYSYYVNRKKSTIVVLHVTGILYGRMYDLSIEELSVL